MRRTLFYREPNVMGRLSLTIYKHPFKRIEGEDYILIQYDRRNDIEFLVQYARLNDVRIEQCDSRSSYYGPLRISIFLSPGTCFILESDMQSVVALQKIGIPIVPDPRFNPNVRSKETYYMSPYIHPNDILSRVMRTGEDVEFSKELARRMGKKRIEYLMFTDWLSLGDNDEYPLSTIY
jgi:hypothetical protein